MEWMDSKELKHLMVKLRERNDQDTSSLVVQQMIDEILEKIVQLKTDCLESIQTSHGQILEVGLLFLKTEAEIINLINCMGLYDFNCDENIETYLEKQKPYANRDYLENINYFAEDYQNIGLLPRFYKYFADTTPSSFRTSFSETVDDT